MGIDFGRDPINHDLGAAGLNFHHFPVLEEGEFTQGGMTSRRDTGWTRTIVTDQATGNVVYDGHSPPSFERFGILYTDNLIADAEKVNEFLRVHNPKTMNIRTAHSSLFDISEEVRQSIER